MNYRSLFRYAVGVERTLPDISLTAQGVSQAAKDFITMLLARDARLRPSASESSQATWMQMAASFDHLQTSNVEDRTSDVSPPSSSSGEDDFPWQPSARWTSDEFHSNVEELPTVAKPPKQARHDLRFTAGSESRLQAPVTAIPIRGSKRTFTGQPPAEGGRNKDRASPFVYGKFLLHHKRPWFPRELDPKKGDTLKVFHFGLWGRWVLASFLSRPDEWGYVVESSIEYRLKLEGHQVTLADAARRGNVSRTALPEGPEARLDPNLDQVYYVNLKNQTITFEQPKLLAARLYTDHNNQASISRPPSPVTQRPASTRRSGRIRSSSSNPLMEPRYMFVQRSPRIRPSSNITPSYVTTASNPLLTSAGSLARPWRPYPEPKLMRLTVKHGFLRSYYVSIYDDLVASDLRHAVERAHPKGFPPRTLVCFEGKDIGERWYAMKLRDMGIKDGSTLQLKKMPSS